MILATTLFATGLGGVACGNTEVPNPIDRCFEQPLPPRPEPAPNTSPIKLREKDGVMTGDPQRLPRDMEAALHDALAIVDVAAPGRDAARGRGYLTQVGDKRIVVTSAHTLLAGFGAETGSLNNVTVTNAKGETSGVTDGCYIHEDSERQKFAPPPTRPKNFSTEPPSPDPNFKLDPKESVVDNDVAVLVLAKPLGESVLSLSQQGPQRGNWDTVGVLGRPGNKTSRELTTFNMVAVGQMGGGATNNSYWYASGLQPSVRAKGGIDSSTFGVSGSPVVALPSGPSINQHLVVNGIVGGGFPKGTLGPDHFKDIFNCEITPFDRTQVEADYVVPAPIIQEALRTVG